MINGLIKMHLAPVHEALAELQEAAEAGRRQGNNFIRRGVVASVVDGSRVVVNIGDNKTPPIQFFVPAAGTTTTYRCPSPGEIAIVLNFGNGDDFQSCVALCGFESGAFPFPSTNPDEVMTVFGKNAWMKVDTIAGKIQFKAASGIEFIETPSVKNIDGDMADKTRSMAADREIFDGHDHPGDSGGNTGKPNQKQGG